MVKRIRPTFGEVSLSCADLGKGVMADKLPEQDVVVRDVQMPFLSMVVFMVKWALAAIAAIGPGVSERAIGEYDALLDSLRQAKERARGRTQR